MSKHGRLIDISLTISPIRDSSGRIVGVSKIARNITAQKRTEAELRESDRRKSEFLAVLAHELRNPLAPLCNGLELIRLGNPDLAADRTHAMMERQLGHLVRLVDDLLDLSRITKGKIELRRDTLDLAAAVGDAVESSRPGIEAAGHQLTVELPPVPVLVNGDRTRLAQVFSNLLNNSARYTERGGRIRIALERHGNDAVVTVADTGVGIPVDALPRIFDMFTQADRPLERALGGLGIGLSLVKGLVELHGGSVTARSDGAGKGSEFSVRLPAPMSAPQGPVTGSTAGPANRTPHHRILVVDDNEDGAASLAGLLELRGHEVRIAHDGIEAIEVAGSFRPNVVLLDLGLPRLSGYDVCRRIREQSWGERMILIAQTGWGQDEDRRRTKEAGFDFHFVKPVDPAALEQLLAKLPIPAP